MKNHFSLKGKKEKGKITRQTLNNFTIIKSITIILMYVSQLKKNIYIYIFLLSHTQIIFLKRQQSLFFAFFTMRHPPFFHRAAPPFPSSCCVLLFSTPHACLLYIQFCHLTLLGTYGVLTFHVSSIQVEMEVLISWA